MISEHDPHTSAVSKPNVPISIDLVGHPQPASTDRPAVMGRMCYLSRLDAVIIPLYPQGQRWHCMVIAHRLPAPGWHGLVVADGQELAAAPTTITVDDQIWLVLAWRCLVWQLWRGGKTHLAARSLAEDLRRPGTLTVDLDPPALLRLCAVTRLRPAGLRRLIGRFVDAVLLQPNGDATTGGWGTYTLSLPSQRRPTT